MKQPDGVQYENDLVVILLLDCALFWIVIVIPAIQSILR